MSPDGDGEIEEKMWYDYKREKYPYIWPGTELRINLVLNEGLDRPTATDVSDMELEIGNEGV